MSPPVDRIVPMFPNYCRDGYQAKVERRSWETPSRQVPQQPRRPNYPCASPSASYSVDLPASRYIKANQPCHMAVPLPAHSSHRCFPQSGPPKVACPNSRFKTVLCNKGPDCPYKWRCLFAHGEEERRVNLKYKTERCKNPFPCPYGDRCLYLHEEDNESSPPISRTAVCEVTGGGPLTTKVLNYYDRPVQPERSEPQWEMRFVNVGNEFINPKIPATVLEVLAENDSGCTSEFGYSSTGSSRRSSVSEYCQAGRSIVDIVDTVDYPLWRLFNSPLWQIFNRDSVDSWTAEMAE